MRYECYVIKLLKSLGVNKFYKGCEFIISSINYINENEETFLPVTKILYVDIAKLYKTSATCVERDIRNVIDIIWQKEENKPFLRKIFGEYNLNKRPTNMEFLVLTYNYIKYYMDCIDFVKKDNYAFICPSSGNKCEYCNEFIMNAICDFYNNL